MDFTFRPSALIRFPNLAYPPKQHLHPENPIIRPTLMQTTQLTAIS